jgi:single-strand DNA-binding protein
MASVNKVILVGNLGRDPEIRYMPSGDAIASFSMAISEKFKDKSGTLQEHTEWVNITFFGRQAEICGEYLKKGASIYVEGRLKTEKFTGKDGIEKTATKVIGSAMQMLGGRGASGGDTGMDQSEPRQSRPASKPAAAPAKASGGGSGFDDMEDDIPF